ncbi:MAG: zinc-binding dehydrogenase [Bacillota bacterium]
MKGLVKYARGVGNMELRDIPEPSPGPREVKIRVKAAGICGTDIHIYYDEYPNVPPLVVGHELSGTVVETGAGAKRFSVGDRVTSETFASTCGVCRFCREGNRNLCPERKSIGSHLDGAFAEYVVIAEDHVRALPEHVDFPEGALCEPLACCVHGVLELTDITPGDVVLVSGPGPIGLICAQLVKAAGATLVVSGTGADRHRLDLARKFGADVTVGVTGEDLGTVIAGLTSGCGADVVIECAGNEASARSCVEVARKQAQYLQMGLFGKSITWEQDTLVFKELTVLGSFSHRKSAWDRAMTLLAERKVDLRPLVSHQLSIDRWREGFEIFEHKQGLKVVLVP